MAFKIVTLDDNGLRHMIARLESTMRADGYVPDIVVGIPRGGCAVARGIFRDVTHCQVTISGHSEGKQRRFYECGLSALPQVIKDALRKMQALWLPLRKKHLKEDDVTVDSITMPHGAKILVIDDAVDSGATMLAVVNAIKKRFPDSDIKTATITVTSESPLFSPDYAIFRDLTLIRFPWSADA